MIGLQLAATHAPKILCLGAHSDDIEIGCGGTILRLAEQYPSCSFSWVVFSALGAREGEARRAAERFAGKRLNKPILKQFQDGFMPFSGAEVKRVFEDELKNLAPDVVFTHNRKDAHQDHRLLSELTGNTFRNHLVLEYEIPKYDGDMGQPNVFVPLTLETCKAKTRNLLETFESQRSKPWFQEEAFMGLMRLRGMECHAPSGYAEAFYGRKLVL
jgi:LmbE family N-acetylglucosaminyl deacetylase